MQKKEKKDKTGNAKKKFIVSLTNVGFLRAVLGQFVDGSFLLAVALKVRLCNLEQ